MSCFEIVSSTVALWSLVFSLWVVKEVVWRNSFRRHRCCWIRHVHAVSPEASDKNEDSPESTQIVRKMWVVSPPLPSCEGQLVRRNSFCKWGRCWIRKVRAVSPEASDVNEGSPESTQMKQKTRQVRFPDASILNNSGIWIWYLLWSTLSTVKKDWKHLRQPTPHAYPLQYQLEQLGHPNRLQTWWFALCW